MVVIEAPLHCPREATQRRTRRARNQEGTPPRVDRQTRPGFDRRIPAGFRQRGSPQDNIHFNLWQTFQTTFTLSLLHQVTTIGAVSTWKILFRHPASRVSHTAYAGRASDDVGRTLVGSNVAFPWTSQKSCRGAQPLKSSTTRPSTARCASFFLFLMRHEIDWRELVPAGHVGTRSQFFFAQPDHLSWESARSQPVVAWFGRPNGPAAGSACSPRAGSARARTLFPPTDQHVGLASSVLKVTCVKRCFM